MIDPEIQRPERDEGDPSAANVSSAPAAPPHPHAVARALAARTPHEPTGDTLNLSRKPFLNSRPVIRTALLLWILGAVLLLVNVSFFWSYLSGSEDKRALIAKGDQEIARREDAVRQLEVRLDTYDLNANNMKVDFLNERIAQRTFSWSLLLERLADVLPNDVRLSRLQPVTGGEGRSGSTRNRSSRANAEPGTIPLAITGQARSNEALLKFQSNLFAHPAFGYPNLLRQSQDDVQSTVITFELHAQYIAGGTPQVSAAPPASISSGEKGAKSSPSPAAAGLTVPPGTSADTLSIRKTPPKAPGGGGR